MQHLMSHVVCHHIYKKTNFRSFVIDNENQKCLGISELVKEVAKI